MRKAKNEGADENEENKKRNGTSIYLFIQHTKTQSISANQNQESPNDSIFDVI